MLPLLRDQGYTTGMIGKWHLGLDWYDANGQIANADLKITDAIWKPGEGAERVRACADRIDFSKPITGGPLDHGFDMFFGVDLPNMPPYAWIDGRNLTAMPTLPKPAGMFGTEGPMVPGWKLEEILPTLGQRSAGWIREKAPSEKPFFLYLSLTSPHTPISPSEPFQGKSGISDYADFIIETDAVVGQVMAALEASGESEGRPEGKHRRGRKASRDCGTPWQGTRRGEAVRGGGRRGRIRDRCRAAEVRWRWWWRHPWFRRRTSAR